MPFSDELKLEVKKRSAFCCCICHRPFDTEIHHIVPESEGGPSIIENAAPLCPNCHSLLGDNSIKRKQITQMRDWWYETCEKIYSLPGPINESRLVQINEDIQRIRTDLKNQNDAIENLKSELREITSLNIEGIAPATASVIASGIVVSASAIQSQNLFPISRKCFACGSEFEYHNGEINCPNCGTLLL